MRDGTEGIGSGSRGGQEALGAEPRWLGAAWRGSGALGGSTRGAWGGNEYFTRRNGRFDAIGRQNTFFSRETSWKRHLYSSTLTHQQLKEPYLFPHSAPFAIQLHCISPFATKKPYLFPHFATFAIQLRYISPSATSSAPSTSLLCSAWFFTRTCTINNTRNLSRCKSTKNLSYLQTLLTTKRKVAKCYFCKKIAKWGINREKSQKNVVFVNKKKKKRYLSTNSQSTAITRFSSVFIHLGGKYYTKRYCFHYSRDEEDWMIFPCSHG